MRYRYAMSIARGAVVLSAFAAQGSFARAAEPSWSGTVTLERSFEHTERRGGPGVLHGERAGA
jgi:hypothetical protein